jgi:hypothetical protein
LHADEALLSACSETAGSEQYTVARMHLSTIPVLPRVLPDEENYTAGKSFAAMLPA